MDFMAAFKRSIPAAVFASSVLCTGAHAQDYLGPHIDTMREHNLLLHQQRMVTPQDDKSEPDRESCLDALPAGERLRALRRHWTEYKKIEEREGMDAAYCWLKAQVDAGR
jgi:hypothetical protein